jgi:hypothetical protein
MPNSLQTSEMAHVIQLSVAPVFLLSGIGALLSVLTTRVGRIVDRTRQIESHPYDSPENRDPTVQRELDILTRRAGAANWAISLCTTCALLICSLIVVLFVGAFVGLDVSNAIALLFVAGMTALIVGLLCFLREIHLAIATLKIRGNAQRHAKHAADTSGSHTDSL